VEYKAAVHPTGTEISQNVAYVEGEIGVCYEKGAEPGHKGTVKGVDTANNQKQEEFPGKKVVLCFFN
jgi:hypothetical protein